MAARHIVLGITSAVMLILNAALAGFAPTLLPAIFEFVPSCPWERITGKDGETAGNMGIVEFEVDIVNKIYTGRHLYTDKNPTKKASVVVSCDRRKLSFVQVPPIDEGVAGFPPNSCLYRGDIDSSGGVVGRADCGNGGGNFSGQMIGYRYLAYTPLFITGLIFFAAGVAIGKQLGT